MALLTPIVPTLTGPLLGAVAASGGGDSFTNTGSETFYVKNGGGAPIDVTFDSPVACSFGIVDDVHDKEVAVAAGEERVIGPFPTSRFNDSNGNVQITYSAVTSVTVAVLRA